MIFFFFQAEDGIRDKLVTGVQTCALPISPPAPAAHSIPSQSPLPLGSAHVASESPPAPAHPPPLSPCRYSQSPRPPTPIHSPPQTRGRAVAAQSPPHPPA